MIRPATPLTKFSLQASDGEIGQVKDLYFDNQHWQLRYFVVETGRWLKQRRVLISPESVAAPAWDKSTLPVALSQDEVRSSPHWDSDRPVSRQYEIDLRQHYAWPLYWGGAPTANTGMGLAVPPPVPATATTVGEPPVESGDPTLFSFDFVKGLHVLASDGEIGHIEEFLIEDRHWGIRYLVVDTKNWWPGNKVILSPWWSAGIDHRDRRIRMDLTREAIKASPSYDPARLPTTEESGRLHDYYGRPRHPDDEIAEAILQADQPRIP